MNCKAFKLFIKTKRSQVHRKEYSTLSKIHWLQLNPFSNTDR